MLFSPVINNLILVTFSEQRRTGISLKIYYTQQKRATLRNEIVFSKKTRLKIVIFFHRHILYGNVIKVIKVIIKFVIYILLAYEPIENIPC